MKVKRILISGVSLLMLFNVSFSAMSESVGELTGNAYVSQGKSGYRVELQLPAGVNDLTPAWSLRYQQGSTNGPLGLGVQLDGLSSIARCSRNEQDDGVNSGLRLDDSDVYCLDGQRLFLISGKLGQSGSEYRTKGNWQTKIVANGHLSSGPQSWTIYSSDGYITHYGSSDDARLTVDGHGLEWFISGQSDRFNNSINYGYRVHQGQHYLSNIHYADVKVEFNYSDRNDKLTAYRFGHKQVLAQKLDAIQIARNNNTLRKLELKYGQVRHKGMALTRLDSVRVCGSEGECMPPHTFEWQTNPYANSKIEQKTLYKLDKFKGFVAGDINRDGLSDICYLNDGLYCGVNQGGDSYGTVTKWSDDFQGNAWKEAEDYASMSLLDINDDSYQDVCAFNHTGFFCALNSNGRTFESGRYWSRNYTIDQAVRLLDSNGDGLVDVCRVEPERVICANNTGGGLSEDYELVNHGYPLEKIYKPISQGHNEIKFSSVRMPQNQFIDINKDGFVDLCGVKLDGHFYCSLGKASDGQLSFHAPELWAKNLPIGLKNSNLKSPGKDAHKRDVKTVEQLVRTFNLADITGDNLPEICYRNGNNYVCHQNTGKSFLPAKVWRALGNDHFEISNDKQNNVAQVEASIMLSDRNRDGLADFCYIAGERLYCAYGNGYSFNNAKHLTNINADLEMLKRKKRYSGNRIKKIFGIKTTVYSLNVNSVYGPYKKGADINGDGLLDDCYRSISGLTCLANEVEPLALLKSVTSGLGVKNGFEYGMTGDKNVFRGKTAPSGLISLTPNFKVVQALSQSNGIGGINRTEYFYKGYYAHKKRGLLGFGEIQTTDIASHRVTTSVTAYHSDWTPYIAKTVTKIKDKTVSQSEFDYQQVNAPVSGKKWPRLTQQRETNWDLSAKLLTSTTTQYSRYDLLNYPGTVTKTTQDGNGDKFTEVTNTRFQHNSQQWLIGKPIEISVTKSNGHDSQTRRTTFTYNLNNGALLEQVLEPGHELSLSTRFGYNSNGFRISEQTWGSGETRQSATTYDAYGKVIKHTNALGHSVQTSYDSRCGLPETVTDANSLVTRFKYDDYCREVKKILPDGNWIAQVYEWSDGADAGVDQYGLTLGDRSVFMVTTQSSQGAVSVSYFDQLGREVRNTQLDGFGKTVIVDKAYDANGRLAGETIPFFENDAVANLTYWIQTSFDDLGRPVTQTQPTQDSGNLVSRMSYQGLTATITGPGSFKKVEQKNGLGQTIKVSENDRSSVRYYYDAVGNLTKTDTNGLITELSYNKLGYKTSMNDPAMGKWIYGYNAWGELVWQQDAKGQRTTFSYDRLGRKTAEVRPDGSNKWQYDQTLKGGLDSAATDNVKRSYTYDKLGRSKSMTLKIDGNSYTTHYQYNEQGRLSRVTFPSGLNLDKDYDINGFLQRTSIPYSDIWDSQHLQIEKALKETSERITELEAKAYELEKSAQNYVEKSERLRQSGQQLLAKSKKYQTQASKLSAGAQSLFRSANINAEQANKYREKASKYWRAFGKRVFKHYKTKNGVAYYKYNRCVKKSRKGNCKKREYFTAQVPLWMVETRNCFSWKGSPYCTNGPKASINLTQVYNQWANHYQAIADKQQAKAEQEQRRADYYQRLYDNTKTQSDKLIAQAKKNADLARQQTEMLSNFTDELDDLVAAEAELKEILDQRLNDETAEILWMATSRDNFGRIGGELFGNGLLTRRDIDRSRGTIRRITTGLGDKYLRDINYTYDARSNVLSKISAIRDQEEYYRYDDFDRLIQWNFSDTKKLISAQRDYRYDIYGNLTYKTGQGSFDVSPNGRLSRGYSYDANGNMLTGRGRTLTWNSFNKVSHLKDNGTVVRYQYGSERERIKQIADGITTYYISPEYQLEVFTDKQGKKITKMRHRIIADNSAVAEHVKTLIEEEKQIDRTAYFHRDALGTADLVTDPNGQVQIERGYTPFGELLASVELQSPPMFINKELRGFTGHENVGYSSNLINMNARLYDPVIGRFLTADTYIPEPGYSQSYNRYAYVLNNPVKFNDPTGHVWGWFIAGLTIFVASQTFDDPMIQKVGAIVGSVMMAYGAGGFYGGLPKQAQIAASGATTSFTTSYVMTGDFADAAEAGAMGGMSALVTYGVAHGATGGTSPFGDALPIAHGVVQGAFHEMRGGSFKQGFIAGVIGKKGGSLVHNGDSTLSLMEAGGLVIVSAVAAAASGANSQDAVLRTAVSVVMIYLHNDIARMKEMNRRSGPTTFRDIRNGLSTIASTSDKVSTACLISGNIPCATFFGSSSLAASGTVLLMDIELNEANIVDGASFSNSVISGAVLPKYAIEALPSQYELPTLIIFDAYSEVSGFMFDEASENYGEKK